MKESERDKFLTKAMGEYWNDIEPIQLCKEIDDYYCENNNFSTWEGFGKLWEWAKEQEWFMDFMYKYDVDSGWQYLPFELVDPDNFAVALYKFLKERE